MDNHNGDPDPKIKAILSEERKLSADQLRALNYYRLNPFEIPAEPGDPWQPFSMADAYEERPPVEYVAEPLFALPSMNVVYSAPGNYKSFLMADCCVTVAGGCEEGFLPPAPGMDKKGARAFKVKQAPAMWIDFDNGRQRTLDRFAALGRARNLPPDIPLTIYSMPNPWLDAGDRAAVGGLINRINDRGAKLVVVDNLGVVSGDADENKADMAKVMSGFRQLAEDTGAAIVLIHHQTKGGSLPGARAGDRLRGHSSIEAALDLALWIDREEYSKTIKIQPTKVRGPDVLPFTAYFAYENKPSRPDELLSARFFSMATDDMKSDQAIEREVLAALEDGPKNKTELVNAVKKALPDMGINRIRDMVSILVGRKLKEVPGEKPRELVYLPL